MRSLFNPQMRGILIGDVITLALVTLIGFANHNTLSTAGVRYFATYLPWLAGWLLFAPHLGAFQPEHTHSARQLWRPFWAMVLASPFAAFLRAIWLNGDISPTFVVVMGGVAALALLAWRALVVWRAARGG